MQKILRLGRGPAERRLYAYIAHSETVGRHAKVAGAHVTSTICAVDIDTRLKYCCKILSATFFEFLLSPNGRIGTKYIVLVENTSRV